jgi:hypothetical protein
MSLFGFPCFLMSEGGSRRYCNKGHFMQLACSSKRKAKCIFVPQHVPAAAAVMPALTKVRAPALPDACKCSVPRIPCILLKTILHHELLVPELAAVLYNDDGSCHHHCHRGDNGDNSSSSSSSSQRHPADMSPITSCGYHLLQKLVHVFWQDEDVITGPVERGITATAVAITTEEFQDVNSRRTAMLAP